MEATRRVSGIAADIRLRRDGGAAGFGFRFRGFPQEGLSIGHTKRAKPLFTTRAHSSNAQISARCAKTAADNRHLNFLPMVRQLC